jgi:hypothetical protein
VVPGHDLVTCLRCGSRNLVHGEDERIRALIARLREEKDATLGRLRTQPVPSI